MSTPIAQKPPGFRQAAPQRSEKAMGLADASKPPGTGLLVRTLHDLSQEPAKRPCLAPSTRAPGRRPSTLGAQQGARRCGAAARLATYRWPPQQVRAIPSDLHRVHRSQAGRYRHQPDFPNSAKKVQATKGAVASRRDRSGEGHEPSCDHVEFVIPLMHVRSRIFSAGLRGASKRYAGETVTNDL
jgi:hypothetical protein